jgi:hypothetical protein
MIDRPIQSILAPLTIEALQTSASATCELLDPQASLVRPVALTPARELAPGQVSSLKALVLDPQSWCFPKKRCLPRETSLFRLKSEKGEVRVSVGMPCLNWTVSGPGERRGGFFDPVHEQVRELLKSLFPEYASSSRRSMWKSGTIARLRATVTEAEIQG